MSKTISCSALSALTEFQLEQINESFADIVVSGSIEQLDAMREESNEPELSHLPRLRLHFDRRRLGDCVS